MRLRQDASLPTAPGFVRFILQCSLPFQSRREAPHRSEGSKNKNEKGILAWLLLPSFIQATDSEGLWAEGPLCAGQGVRSQGTRGSLSLYSWNSSLLLFNSNQPTGKNQTGKREGNKEEEVVRGRVVVRNDLQGEVREETGSMSDWGSPDHPLPA